MSPVYLGLTNGLAKLARFLPDQVYFNIYNLKQIGYSGF